MTVGLGAGFARTYLEGDTRTEPVTGIRNYVRRPPVPALASDASTQRPRAARAVRANAGISAAYRRRLDRLVDEMCHSVGYWVEAAYRRQESRIATDESPADLLRRVVGNLRRRWLRRFDRAAEDMAKWFAASVKHRNEAELAQILKKAGFTVEFRLTRTVRDALDAIVAENVALIRSIPQQYLGQVEGSVMRSVVEGRDLYILSEDLQRRHHVTRNRAAFIALDQNQKATSAIQELRYLEVGIVEAIWHHSHAGKTPRPTHVAMDGQRFKVRDGIYDSHERKMVKCGQLPRCRCFFTPILPGS